MQAAKVLRKSLLTSQVSAVKMLSLQRSVRDFTVALLVLKMWETSPMTSSARLDYLDILRTIAIVSVVAAHSAQTIGDIQRGSGSDIDPWLLSFFNQGGYGVQVFFFLSGYLLAMLYGFSSMDLRKEKSTRSFWLRRIFRIVPLWFLFLLVTVYRPNLFPQSPGSWPPDGEIAAYGLQISAPWLFVLSLLFLMWLVPVAWGGFIPGGWSIQAEMLHYLFFAAVRKWRIEWILGSWLFLAIPLVLVDKILIRVDLDLGPIEGWRSQNVASTLIFFLAGCIAYLLCDRNRRQKLTANQKLLTLASVTVMFLLPLNNVKSGQAFAAFGFVVYAILLAYPLSRVGRLSSTFQNVAKYSYFTYFAHFFVLDIIEVAYLNNLEIPLPGGQIGVGVAVLLTILLVTLVCSLVGWVSWQIFENPMIGLGNKLESLRRPWHIRKGL